MQKYKVIVTRESVYDIVEIADYIEAQFGIARANRFQEEIKERPDKLEILGGVFGKTYPCYRGYSIYKSPFPPSVIFYIFMESEKEIHVLRILREERDWESIFLNTIFSKEKTLVNFEFTKVKCGRWDLNPEKILRKASKITMSLT